MAGAGIRPSADRAVKGGGVANTLRPTQRGTEAGARLRRHCGVILSALGGGNERPIPDIRMVNRRQGSRGGKSRPTIADIARRLHLSAMTVSRALNRDPAVKPETREKVLKAAAKLRYRPNRWARALATGESKIVGVVVPDISHTFFSDITRGIQDELETEGYSLTLCDSNGNPKREETEIEMLLSTQADGIIVASQQPADSPGILNELLRLEMPLVLIDRFFAGLDCARVRADDFKVGELAARHLIRLGHTRIALITGPNVSTSLLRTDGFLSVMRASGLLASESWIVPSDYTFSGGADAMKLLLQSNPRPTAVFAANDPVAIGAIRVCRAAGLAVPGGISIIGAGNIEGHYSPDPFLTSLDWPREGLGRRAARMLLELIGDPSRLEEKEKEYVAEPVLLVRKSTGPPS